LPGSDGLERTGRLVKDGLVTDGPYVEAKEIIASFSVIQADDNDALIPSTPPKKAIKMNRR